MWIRWLDRQKSDPFARFRLEQCNPVRTLFYLLNASGRHHTFRTLISSQRLHSLFIPLLLFFAIWGQKMNIIDRFGSDIPYWDQWNGEGQLTIIPWKEGQLSSTLFSAHSEHRIVPTRLTVIGLVALSGQWDARMQCVFNGAVHAAIGAILLSWFARCLTSFWYYGFALLLLFAIGSLIPSENILSGFQSQFYYLVGLSLLAIYLLLAKKVFTLAWTIGVVVALVSIVTMGSGFLCATPVFAMSLVAAIRNPENRRDAIVTLLVSVVVIVIGVFQMTPAPHHDVLKAKSVSQFLLFAAQAMSWPMISWPWLSFFFVLPWALLALMWLLRGDTSDKVSVFVVAAGMWVAVQIAAASYARSGGGDLVPSSRYGDVTGLMIVFGFLSLTIVTKRLSTIKSVSLGSLYLMLIAVAGAKGSWWVWHNSLPHVASERRTYVENVHAFVLSDKFEDLVGKTIPFPHDFMLRDFLRSPILRALLPVSIGEPLRVDGMSLAGPDLPPIYHRRVKKILAGQSWSSPTLPATHGWWKIEMAGSYTAPDTGLMLVSERDGTILATIAPTKVDHANWRAAYVRAPNEPAKLVGKAGDTADFLAFSEPIEMSALSYRIWILCKYGAWIAASFSVLILAVALLDIQSTQNGFKLTAGSR